jgi:hypothetical protein
LHKFESAPAVGSSHGSFSPGIGWFVVVIRVTGVIVVVVVEEAPGD